MKIYSEKYKGAIEEFTNCPCFEEACMDVPFVLTFKKWWSTMQRKRQKPLKKKNKKGAENGCLS